MRPARRLSEAETGYTTRMKRLTLLCAVVACIATQGLGMLTARADADPPKSWQEVRALIARFMDAQNAHNLDVTGALLWNSPDFQMQAPDALIRGHDEAVTRFNALYQGMWRLSPDYSGLDIKITSPGRAQFTVPVEYKTGEANGDPITTQSILQASAIRTGDGWRIASIMPQPPPVTTR